MQNVRTVEDFKQSFQLVDHYNQMKESCFKDYEIKMHGGNVITNQDYKENISNTPGTAGGPGGRDRTLAVKSRKTAEKSAFFVKK